MAELIDVFKALTSKSKWSDITDEDKIKNFFIINRYMSKKYPSRSQLLNLKTVDKVSSMDLWYQLMKTEPYPSWFWSKGEKLEKSDISEKEYVSLLHKLRIKDIDLDYLIENHIDFIKDELKELKEIEKRNK